MATFAITESQIGLPSADSLQLEEPCKPSLKRKDSRLVGQRSSVCRRPELQWAGQDQKEN